MKYEFFYESNDKTTISILRRSLDEDAAEMVQAAPTGIGSAGHETEHVGPAATHRPMDM